MRINVKEIIKKGALPYKHIYMQTMTGHCEANHVLDVPKTLITLAEKPDTVEIVTYTDGDIGIEINGKVWATDFPKNYKELPHEVLQYCRLAIGQNADTYAP